MTTASPLVTAADSAKQSTRMEDTTARARRVIAAALIGAIPVELLLRAIPGVNVPLAALVVAGALLWVSRFDARALRARAALMIVLVALASIAAVRGESLLWLATFVGMAATLTLAVLPDGSWLRAMDPAELLGRAAAVMVRSLAGPFWMLMRALDWKAVLPDRGVTRHARGIAIALLVLLPFLGLFSSADPAFAAIVRDVIDLDRIFSHVALWGVFAWLALGWLGVALFPDEGRLPVKPRLPGGDATWMLGLLSALFAAFVAVQFHYFYGGEELVLATTGLTYADYARRGFFELVTVAALLLAVLLASDWLTREAEPNQRRVLRWLSLALIALLAVILVSALQRMNLYIEAYGLTQLRFFTTAFMFWLVIVFAWFCATVLQDRRERFLGGVYATGIAAVFVLAAIDPIGRIAEYDVEFGRRTGRHDAVHLASLGPDAVPALIEVLPEVPAEQRCPAVTSLLRNYTEETDIRSWNHSRERARALVLPLAPAFERECTVNPPVEGETR